MGPPCCSGTARALRATGFSSARVRILATVRGYERHPLGVTVPKCQNQSPPDSSVRRHRPTPNAFLGNLWVKGDTFRGTSYLKVHPLGDSEKAQPILGPWTGFEPGRLETPWTPKHA
ncbi:hypothetical protein E2C01_056718 [Portunus trituberculatus]|uniref:Uncharacterized protein n=1 Tax=Portunus trituberculatus TaxID=210409 RepID=A0A5B7GYI6_PORTR|nr:hypothetical protein [Portunus trituberculatus]